MPTAQDLDDPIGYTERRVAAEQESADVDAAIEALLDAEEGGGADRPGDADR
jgi:hypothetical protein